jgi:hypothetical protein
MSTAVQRAIIQVMAFALLAQPAPLQHPLGHLVRPLVSLARSACTRQQDTPPAPSHVKPVLTSVGRMLAPPALPARPLLLLVRLQSPPAGHALSAPFLCPHGHLAPV